MEKPRVMCCDGVGERGPLGAPQGVTDFGFADGKLGCCVARTVYFEDAPCGADREERGALGCEFVRRAKYTTSRPIERAFDTAISGVLGTIRKLCCTGRCERRRSGVPNDSLLGRPLAAPRRERCVTSGPRGGYRFGNRRPRHQRL